MRKCNLPDPLLILGMILALEKLLFCAWELESICSYGGLSTLLIKSSLLFWWNISLFWRTFVWLNIFLPSRGDVYWGWSDDIKPLGLFSTLSWNSWILFSGFMTWSFFLICLSLIEFPKLKLAREGEDSIRICLEALSSSITWSSGALSFNICCARLTMWGSKDESPRVIVDIRDDVCLDLRLSTLEELVDLSVLWINQDSVGFSLPMAPWFCVEGWYCTSRRASL